MRCTDPLPLTLPQRALSRPDGPSRLSQQRHNSRACGRASCLYWPCCRGCVKQWTMRQPREVIRTWPRPWKRGSEGADTLTAARAGRDEHLAKHAGIIAIV